MTWRMTKRLRELSGDIVRMDVKSIMYVGVTLATNCWSAGAVDYETSPTLEQGGYRSREGGCRPNGIAIRQARLYQKAEATSMREALANKLSVAIRASLSLADVLDTTTRELGQALSASLVRVRLYDQAGRSIIGEHQYLATGCKSAGEHNDNY